MSTPDRRTLIADTAIALVAAAGLRGLTHRAVDGAARLPAGSTSYYFRTRTALIGACYQRLAELDLGDVEADLGAEFGGDVGGDVGLDVGGGSGADPGGDRGQAEGGAVAAPGGPAGREAAAKALAEVLHRWLTTGRTRQLARFELSLEAARNPELEPELHRAGQRARARAARLLAALGAQRPQESAELLAAWTDGLLYDRLVGALARSRPAPDRTELATVARRMLDAALAGNDGQGSGAVRGPGA
ncbi:TetR/AcrR family transcriptional regulator [Streptomyces sp. NPDC056387]|uniref:TetR/AcrR family transcriptional regulator n=1 Tax=Streptomyces sp. NPDC056387 TaxID=3345803 RepID=UPI0035D9AC8A